LHAASPTEDGHTTEGWVRIVHGRALPETTQSTQSWGVPMLPGGFITFALYMLAFYFLFLFIWMFIVTVADVFKRDDLSGWAKAGWLILLFWLPLIGVLAYVITKPASLRG
jgi:hypothetical protein